MKTNYFLFIVGALEAFKLLFDKTSILVLDELKHLDFHIIRIDKPVAQTEPADFLHFFNMRMRKNNYEKPKDSQLEYLSIRIISDDTDPFDHMLSLKMTAKGIFIEGCFKSEGYGELYAIKERLDLPKNLEDVEIIVNYFVAESYKFAEASKPKTL